MVLRYSYYMLKWFVGKDVAASAIDDRKLIDRRPRTREDIRSMEF